MPHNLNQRSGTNSNVSQIVYCKSLHSNKIKTIDQLKKKQGTEYIMYF